MQPVFFINSSFAADLAFRGFCTHPDLSIQRLGSSLETKRRPIFIATLWAGASWPFFCVALSARMIQIRALVRALKNSQLTSGKIYVISGTGH